MPKLAVLAAEISSKNAGNFMLTFDVVFDDSESYERVKRSGVINRETIAALYHVDPRDVTNVVEFDQGAAYKIALRRAHPSGAVGESDVYGAQQYAPLLEINVP